MLTKFTQLFHKPAGKVFDSDPHSPTLTESALVERQRKHKRREDAIRATELNQLRGIIQDSRGMKPTAAPEARVTPTQQPHSAKDAVERNIAVLDKIDGAEAHLDKWWGTASAALHPEVAQLPPDSDMELDFTGMLALSEDQPSRPNPISWPGSPDEEDEIVALTPLDTCLHDAALHYAEGEFDAAQNRLATMLELPTTDGESAELLTFSLFDVYRCSGDQERFDALALAYANRYGRSPGEWYSIPEQAAAEEMQSQAAQQLDGERAHQTLWKCPTLLDLAALASCTAHQPQSSQVISINWLPLGHIDPTIAPAFAKQVLTWGERQLELHWAGVDVLLAATQACRLGGAAGDGALWWLIQLDLLCILERPQAFDELALEYCVAFEVSPPSWKQMACKLVQTDDVTTTPDFVMTVPIDADTQDPLAYISFELKGNITGHDAQSLRELAIASNPVSQITVTCLHLGRIDFNATVVLLKWLRACHDRQCQVIFTHLPRLVLVYFETVGIQELATLSTGSH